MLNINEIARLYNTSAISDVKEIDSSRGDLDKRYTFLLTFNDGQQLAIKACRNSFTGREKIAGWKKLCKAYLDLGIYCPQIITSVQGNESEIIIAEDQEYHVYAEEIKKYKAYNELDSKPDFKNLKGSIVESVGKIAADCDVILPWPSVYCVYDTFCAEDKVDENYENAEAFCNKIKNQFKEYSEYADAIWELFLIKRNAFEPVYRKLPKASFQSDLNSTNILVDENQNFTGLIDFNLSGSIAVLCYIILCEVCGYCLKTSNLEHLTQNDFLEKCDDYLYKNIKLMNKHYEFSDYEKEHFCLCYNTVYPFSYWMINGMLDYAIRENKTQYIKEIMDWVYYQLSRDDIKI